MDEEKEEEEDEVVDGGGCDCDGGCSEACCPSETEVPLVEMLYVWGRMSEEEAEEEEEEPSREFARKNDEDT